MVDVGGHRLSARLTGTGRPVVVLEAHLGGSKSVWKKVWRDIARFTTVCVYDRAGLGDSDPGAPPRTIVAASEDLRRLLERLSPLPPYVLVGHSFGGLIVQAFARRYPKLVCGIVLVDSSHADQLNRLWRLLTPKGRVEVMASLRAPNAERIDLRRSEALARRPGCLPHVPLRVLYAPAPAYAMEQFPDRRAARRVIAEMERELSDLAPQGRLVRVSRSGHFIQLDRPEVVIRHIRAVVNQARRSLALDRSSSR